MMLFSISLLQRCLSCRHKAGGRSTIKMELIEASSHQLCDICDVEYYLLCMRFTVTCGLSASITPLSIPVREFYAIQWTSIIFHLMYE